MLPTLDCWNEIKWRMTALATLRGLVRLAISNISSTASYALCENIEATTMYLRKVYWKSFTVDVSRKQRKNNWIRQYSLRAPDCNQMVAFCDQNVSVRLNFTSGCTCVTSKCALFFFFCFLHVKRGRGASMNSESVAGQWAWGGKGMATVRCYCVEGEGPRD